MANVKERRANLTIIGTGMAGMAAACFAARNRIDTVQIGVNSGLIYSSGYLDLMAIHPIGSRMSWNNPWQAIDQLVVDHPDHPYARLRKADIKTALDQFLDFMAIADHPYVHQPDKNTEVMTPVGTVKRTYAVPESMWEGAVALKERKSCLVVDFTGLKAFSAKQIADMLMPRWPGIRPLRLTFPAAGASADLYPEQMARSLEIEKNRIRLADAIKPHIGDAKAVGLPAILGIYSPNLVRQHLEALLNLKIFEIPTIPPSIPGLRLKESMEKALTAQNIHLIRQKRVLSVKTQPNGGFLLGVGDQGSHAIEQVIDTRAVLLAGGRFLGMGLHAGRKKIREPLFDLPVFQPEDRALWHDDDFFSPHGHPINQAGLEIDDHFRPVDPAGKPVYKNMFAAGAILAHQDWMRQKCGAGLAIATAYGAVAAIRQSL